MKNKKLVYAVLGFVILIAVISFFAMPNVKTEMALSDKIEDLSKHKGIVIRNESIVRSDAGEPSTMMNGVFKTHVSEGEYVKRFKNVATMYKSDDNPATADIQKKLAKVIDRINQITTSNGMLGVFEGDKAKLDTKMSDYIREFVKSSNDKDGRGLSRVISELNIASGRNNQVNTATSKLIEELNKLTMEKEQYEQMLSNLKIPLYSSSSGIFSSKMDGYEEILTKNTIKDISVSDFNRIYDEEKPQISGCKIIDNYEWYAIMEVDKKRAQNFEIGETVYLRFDTISKDFEAYVENISPVKNGKCIISVCSNEYDVDISSLRKTDISLIKNIHKGLKIPSGAIREKDGKTGVYIVKSKVIRFIETDVLYNDGEYAIVKEDNLVSSSLLLYDEVVVSGRNIYEGKGVR